MSVWRYSDASELNYYLSFIWLYCILKSKFWNKMDLNSVYSMQWVCLSKASLKLLLVYWYRRQSGTNFFCIYQLLSFIHCLLDIIFGVTGELFWPLGCSIIKHLLENVSFLPMLHQHVKSKRLTFPLNEIKSRSGHVLSVRIWTDILRCMCYSTIFMLILVIVAAFFLCLIWS